jgi:hypothetical protein
MAYYPDLSFEQEGDKKGGGDFLSQKFLILNLEIIEKSVINQKVSINIDLNKSQSRNTDWYIVIETKLRYLDIDC